MQVASDQRTTLGLGDLATATGTWTNGSSFAGTSSGTNTGDQTITLTGAVLAVALAHSPQLWLATLLRSEHSVKRCNDCQDQRFSY